MFLAVPYVAARAVAADPQIFMRLAEVGAFAACLCLVFAIARRIFPEPRLAWLSVLFAASSAAFATWTTQLRGDLPAAACSLLAIYLILRADCPRRVLAAGACAGLAIAIKQTFVAAPLAILIWLMYRRRIKLAGQFATAALFAAACVYGLAVWREPLLLQHLAALRSAATLDLPGALALLFKELAQPVTPLAVLGVLLFLRERSPGRMLLLLYCLAAWTVAALTLLQAGGNVNYFWEPWLASSVLMAAGLRELERIAKRLPVLPAVFAALFIPTVLHDFYYLRTSVHQAGSYGSRKQRWQALTSALHGKRLLSTFPDVSILGQPPEMPDPFLNTELERAGLWNPQPVLDATRSRSYEILITGKGEERAPQSYRGIPLWSEAVWSAANSAYQPVCVVQDRFTSLEAWLPRGSSALLPELMAAGCISQETGPTQ